jgi:hypothetical protein
MTIKGDKVFSDLISKTLAEATALSASYWYGLPGLLDSIANGEDEPRITKAKKRMAKYQRAYDIDIDGVKFYLTAKPNSSSMAPIRIEYNPSRLKSDTLQKLGELWSKADGSGIPLPALFSDARITRLDIAVDILNLWIADIYPHVENAKKVWMAIEPKTGIQTAYFHWTTNQKTFGHQKQADLSIYDKRQQLEDTGTDNPFEGVPYTRVELRLNKKCHPDKLAELPYPFEKIFLRRGIVNEPIMDQRIWSMFLDSMRFRGRENALKLLPEELLEGKIAKEKKYAPSDLITKETIWPHWQEALKGGQISSLIDWATAPIGTLHEYAPNSVPNFD